MERILERELLDHLAPHEVSAQVSRRDLRRINHLMGNFSWMRRTMRRLVRPGDRVLELGAGDGGLAPAGHYGRHDGLDRWPRPDDWPRDAEWHQTDLRRFSRWADYEVICGNLVFHHFSAMELAWLGERIAAHARLVVACEPHRSPAAQRLFGLVCAAIGAGEVTRHDGRVSIAAGFRDDELPRRLGLDPAQWRVRVHTTCRGAYHLVAERT